LCITFSVGEGEGTRGGEGGGWVILGLGWVILDWVIYKGKSHIGLLLDWVVYKYINIYIQPSLIIVQYI